MHWTRIAGPVVSIVSLTTPAFSQCGHWVDPEASGGLPGFDGAASAVIRWDPDGNGPQIELTVVGGTFLGVGDTKATNLVAWDGSRWLDLWRGHPLVGGIADLVVYQGSLVACGNFVNADGQPVYYIARWTGDNWMPLGTGLGYTAHTMAVYKGELIVGGAFLTASDNLVNFVARWDGENWKPLGGGFDNYVYSLAVYDGLLFAGGTFTTADGRPASRIAAWDGVSWVPLGAGTNARTKDLFVYDGKLIATGSFTSPAAKIAAWNGVEWSSLAGGLAGPTTAGGTYLTEFNGDLIVSGDFTAASGETAGGVARWDGQAWHALGDSYGGGAPCLQIQEQLFAFGPRFASWNGSDWQAIAFGFDGRVSSIVAHNNAVAVGGYFSHSPGGAHSFLAAWQHGEWNAIGTPDRLVFRLVSSSSGLIAFGNFLNVGGTPAKYAAIDDGSGWKQLAAFSSIPADAVDFQGSFFVGGDFVRIDGLQIGGIARQSGNSWSGVGLARAHVKAFAVFQGNLYAAGVISPTSNDYWNLARFDGVAWYPIISNSVHNPIALAASFDSLYVATPSVVGVAGMNVFRWNGTTMHPLSEGLDGRVNALAMHNGALFAAGVFRHAGALAVNRVARWDGSSWSALGDGVNAEAFALASDGRHLIIGGNFTAAGDFVAGRLARWSESCCLGDLNDDGVVDDADFNRFVYSYNLLDCSDVSMRPTCRGDLDNDGVVSDSDFSIFVVAYDELVCPD